MSPSRARFVTACQQLLALGVVVVALVPATRVVSLDVVGVRPSDDAGQPTIEVPARLANRAEGSWGQGRCGRHEVSVRVAERREPASRCVRPSARSGR